MDEFYLSLLSDSSIDIYPKNKQFSFTKKLNQPIQVQKEQWVVALVEIMTPSEVYNISHNTLGHIGVYSPRISPRSSNHHKQLYSTGCCQSRQLI